jgi:hypothetical protein
MTFLQALYGSQYYELTQKGKEVAKGRLNGNLFLSAFIIVLLFLVIILSGTIWPGFMDKMNSFFHHLFGYTSGKTIGRLLAIPLLFLIYLIVSLTIGSKKNYQRICGLYIQLPETEKKKANALVLFPFMIALGSLFILSMISLFQK